MPTSIVLLLQSPKRFVFVANDVVLSPQVYHDTTKLVVSVPGGVPIHTPRKAVGGKIRKPNFPRVDQNFL